MNLLERTRRLSSRSGSGSSPVAISKSLRWTLAVTLIASAVALIWPKESLVEAQSTSVRASAGPAERARSDTGKPVRNARSDANLSSEGPMRSFALVDVKDARDITTEAGAFDPFVGPVAPPPPTPPVVHVVPPPPPPPAPPPMTYRFMGSLEGPDGSKQVFLSRGDSVIPVAIGSALDDGYLVEALSDEAATLGIPTLGVHVTIKATQPTSSR